LSVVVRAQGLRKTFGSNRIYDDVTLDVQAGEVLTILGGSGTGKSVLLKCIVGLLHPDAGALEVFGESLPGPFDASGWMALRRRVGFLFQGAALFDSMSVFGNISYPLLANGWDDSERIASRVAQTLELVGLPGIESKMPAELSGGMKKRVGLARAIAIEPELILYDEPTTGLDPSNVHRINRLIRNLQEKLGVTSLVVTHDMESAYAVSDRFALLWERRILWSGTVDEARSSDNAEVRGFIDGTLGE